MFRSAIVSICLFQYILASQKFDRLLLNDPSLVMERLMELENKVQRLSNQLQNNVNNTKDIPAFFVILTTSKTFGNDQILKFDTVKTNAGGGYDALTGVFIAPKSGIYQITSVVYSLNNDNVEVQLNKNNELLLKGYSVGTNYATSHTMNAVVELQKGDHIYVQHRGGAIDNVYGEALSSFSGFMISE